MFLTNARCVNIVKYSVFILSDQMPIIEPCNIYVGLSGALSNGFFRRLTSVTGSSVPDVAGVLDPSL